MYLIHFCGFQPQSPPHIRYRGCSKLRTRTALGSYSRPMPRSIGPPWGRCVSLITSSPVEKNTIRCQVGGRATSRLAGNICGEQGCSHFHCAYNFTSLLATSQIRWLVQSGGNPGANLMSISHRCHPILVAFAWELTKQTINLPLGCLQGGESLPSESPPSTVQQGCLHHKIARPPWDLPPSPPPPTHYRGTSLIRNTHPHRITIGS